MSPCYSGFVLRLDPDDGMLLAIHSLDMPHQGRQGAGIGIPRGLAEPAAPPAPMSVWAS